MSIIPANPAQFSHISGDAPFRKALGSVHKNMKQRCTNPNASKYEYYGGRGVNVSPGWLLFRPFYEWAIASGYLPGLQIDRIDNNGDYGPENCRWATPTQNNRNRSNTIHISAFDETKTAAEWAADGRCTVGAKTIQDRCSRGIAAETAITARRLWPSPQDQSDGNRRCRCCKLRKPFGDFSKDRYTLTGLAGKCRQCVSSRNALNGKDLSRRSQEWASANPDRAKAAASRYYQKQKALQAKAPPCC